MPKVLPARAGLLAPLVAVIPGTYQVQARIITSSKDNQNSPWCQLTPPLHAIAAQIFPLLAFLWPCLATCFSHGCATNNLHGRH
ncbi:hypothetical protein HDV63DRAFT_184462 [Trichoderma sp. SZMC 28014]